MRKFRAYADGQMHECLEDWWWYIGDNEYWSLNDEYGKVVCDSLESENPVLLQYTGLKDKNGLDICEGDVVDPQGGSVKEIVYIVDQWGSGFQMRKHDGQLFSLSEISKFVEVIGNIHENPSLLVE